MSGKRRRKDTGEPPAYVRQILSLHRVAGLSAKEYGENRWRLVGAATEHPALSSTAVVVCAHVAARIMRPMYGGAVWASRKTIARAIGISESVVGSSWDALVKAGLFTPREWTGEPTVYLPIWPADNDGDLSEKSRGSEVQDEALNLSEKSRGSGSWRAANFHKKKSGNPIEKSDSYPSDFSSTYPPEKSDTIPYKGFRRGETVDAGAAPSAPALGASALVDRYPLRSGDVRPDNHRVQHSASRAAPEGARDAPDDDDDQSFYDPAWDEDDRQSEIQTIDDDDVPF